MNAVNVNVNVNVHYERPWRIACDGASSRTKRSVRDHHHINHHHDHFNDHCNDQNDTAAADSLCQTFGNLLET